MLRPAVAASLALALFPLLAQVPEKPPSAPEDTAGTSAPIRVHVNEVIVPVTVTDDKGRFVSDLDRSDFKIFDEGKPQTISYFTRDRSQPVVVGFLVDMSNGMKIHWKKYQDAVTELVQNLLPGDKKFAGYLITYGNQPQLEVDTTSDPEAMVDKISKMKPAGGAALFDAVWTACTSRKTILGEPFAPRRILVIIGDGHDTASKHSLNEVIEIAQRNLVTVYGMSTLSFGFRNNAESEDNMRRLAEETGGRVEYPLDNPYKDVAGYLEMPQDEGNYALKVGTGQYAAEISGAIYHAVADIAGEITTQYIIRYVPDSHANSKDRAFHNIKVQVNLPNVKLRYRKGYFPGSAG